MLVLLLILFIFLYFKNNEKFENKFYDLVESIKLEYNQFSIDPAKISNLPLDFAPQPI